MPDIVTQTAVLGRTQLMPAILPVTTTNPSGDCLVAHGFPSKLIDPKRQLDLDITDCTLFTVTHRDKSELDFRTPAAAEELFEQALQAISEVTIWNKAIDRAGKVSPFLRQIGRLDAKYFFIQAPDETLIGWRNPLFWAERNLAAMMAGFLGNMIMTNGPSANPMPGITRRVMGALDLINLGFYTESFISLFSLVDDLTQEVVKAGMARKGLDLEQQRSMLRAIKEERLKHFVGNLTKLCDWQSLSDFDNKLYERLLAANTRRNNIMHGSTRLYREQTIESSNTLLEVIDWLRTNPFEYSIPRLPLLTLASGEFFIAPIDSDKAEPATSIEADA